LTSSVKDDVRRSRNVESVVVVYIMIAELLAQRLASSREQQRAELEAITVSKFLMLI
jgi:hypothetical protein